MERVVPMVCVVFCSTAHLLLLPCFYFPGPYAPWCVALCCDVLVAVHLPSLAFKFWQNVNDRINYYAMLYAYTAENARIFDSQDEVNVFCMQWTLVPVMQRRADYEVFQYNRHRIAPNKEYGTPGGVPNRSAVEHPRPRNLDRQIPDGLTLEYVLEMAREELGDHLKLVPDRPLHHDPISGSLGDLRNDIATRFRDSFNLSSEELWEDMVAICDTERRVLWKVYSFHLYMTQAISASKDADLSRDAFIALAPNEEWRREIVESWDAL